MPTKAEYSIAANQILNVLHQTMDQLAGGVPDIGSWRERAAPAMAAAAGAAAKAALDAVDLERAKIIPIQGATVMADPIPPAAAAAGTDVIHQVLGYLQAGCGIIAAPGPISMLIGALPYGSTAFGIANMVCEAVFAMPKKLSRGGPESTVTVEGIQIPVHASPFEK